MTRAKTKKVDLRKELKHLYNPSAKEVSVVDVPEMSFLMVDGEGDPNTSEWYGQAVEPCTLSRTRSSSWSRRGRRGRKPPKIDSSPKGRPFSRS